MGNQNAGTLQAKPMMTKHTIGVEHITIESTKSFLDVRAALERNVPQLDPTLVKALADGDVERANREKQQGPELSIFGLRDHGALLAIAGKARNALQYEWQPCDGLAHDEASDLGGALCSDPGRAL